MVFCLVAPRVTPRPFFLLRVGVVVPQLALFKTLLARSITKRKYTQSANETVRHSLKQYTRWYPEDTSTSANIDTYFELRRNVLRRNVITVGVIYQNEHTRHSSKLIPAILADPLAGNSEAWYRALAGRLETANNIFNGEEQLDRTPQLVLPEAFQRVLESYQVCSPMLEADSRPRYEGALPVQTSAANNLQIVEVNKPLDVQKLVDVCSFYIYVASDLSTLMDTLPRHVRKKIRATVVDNTEYSPRSTETSAVSFLDAREVARHVIKVDSHVLDQGIEAFYKEGTAAASQYFDSLQASNILELRKFLLWSLRTENLAHWLMTVIKTEIASNNLSETQLRQIYDDLKLNALAKGSLQMHAELQTDLIPETTAFFNHKLRWYMLYMKNDNIEYAVKDFFSLHFMNKSIDGYNYLKGQLVARLQEQKFAQYLEKNKFELNNPLQSFKNDLINNRVPRELQLVVYSSITSAFIYYQLPLSALSLLGYLWVGLDLHSAIAIASLGWVLGFNHVSKTWHNFTNSWLHNLFDEVRLVISKECVDEGLLKELNARFESAKALAKIKQQVLADLEDASAESTRVHQDLREV